jgi:hypothetical protein
MTALAGPPPTWSEWIAFDESLSGAKATRLHRGGEAPFPTAIPQVVEDAAQRL